MHTVLEIWCKSWTGWTAPDGANNMFLSSQEKDREFRLHVLEWETSAS